MNPVTRTGVTTFTTPGDREIVITRVVRAPRERVFAAFHEPQHVSKWLLGPPGWTMPVCEIDLRPGGRWRFGYRKANGTEMEIAGSYREVVPPERVVSTESWGPDWPESVNTLVLTEVDGLTTITITSVYPTREARDAALASGMNNGMDMSFAHLDTLLAGVA